MFTGKVLRVDRIGLGFIECTGQQYSFTFDKVQNYRGEEPREIGLYEGCVVKFTVAQDGLSINNVVIASDSNA